jgi:hypothetical protein
MAVRNNEISFFGATHSKILERKFNWPEGVEMLKNLSDMERVITKQWSKTWSLDDGDEMDMERYFNDMAFLHKRIKVLGARARSNAIQKIMINVCENAYVDAEKMLWKTYAVVKLADQLESQGVRCEIVLFESSREIDKHNRNLLIEIPLKQLNEPINISLLCTVLSPWFLRYWLFQFEHMYIDNVDDGLGYSRKLDPELTENCIVIDSGTALSKEAANNFLKGIDL